MTGKTYVVPFQVSSETKQRNSQYYYQQTILFLNMEYVPQHCMTFAVCTRNPSKKVIVLGSLNLTTKNNNIFLQNKTQKKTSSFE